MARKDYGSKPYLLPEPVLIIATYDNEGNPNAMNAAWGGISEEDELSICLSANHKTTYNLLEKKAFTVSFGDKKHVKECDYLGIESGNNVKDKLAKCGLTVTKSEKVDAPIINEFPVSMECTVKEYNPDTCILKAKIINVSVDESVLTNGRFDLTKAELITFEPFNNAYHVIGERVGKAFADGGVFK